MIAMDAPIIGKFYRECMKTLLEDNAELLDIQEGNLLKYVERELQKELSAQAFENTRYRIPPINVQKRVIDKLSQIYIKSPERSLGDTATDQDKEMWNWYVEEFDLDVSGQTMNEYFNLHKSCAWEPYLNENGHPRLREIPKDRFFVMGMDPMDPMRVTHFVKVMGKTLIPLKGGKQGDMEEVTILFVYTDTEFKIVYDNGDVADAEMLKRDLDRSNPFGVIPFVYLNRSKTHINAPQDTDLYRMTTLVPILFADVNYALKFQAFSLWYGINVDGDIKIAPNFFVNLKATQDNPGVTPSIGTIKPEVDSDKAMQAIMEQIALWLQSRNIRPGAIGKISAETQTSGISKMVDEMDTTGDRSKQMPYFTTAEEELFSLVAYRLHPLWVRDRRFQQRAVFTPDLTYRVKFADVMSWQTRKEILEELKLENELGIVSKDSMMMRANPDMSPEEREAEIEKIQGETPAPPAPPEETEEENGAEG
jgi:hypothetical protein